MADVSCEGGLSRAWKYIALHAGELSTWPLPACQFLHTHTHTQDHGLQAMCKAFRVQGLTWAIYTNYLRVLD